MRRSREASEARLRGAWASLHGQGEPQTSVKKCMPSKGKLRRQ